MAKAEQQLKLKKARNTVYRLLKIRMRSEQEIRDHLKRKNFTQEIIDFLNTGNGFPVVNWSSVSENVGNQGLYSYEGSEAIQNATVASDLLSVLVIGREQPYLVAPGGSASGVHPRQ